jgi:hypothetical protein
MPKLKARAGIIQGCQRDVRHPPFAERRALAFCVFEMTSGRGFAPNVRAANEWMCGTVTKVWMFGIPKDGCLQPPTSKKSREMKHKSPSTFSPKGLLSENSRDDKTPLELFLAGIRALALESSIIEAVGITSRLSSATGGH